MKRGCLALLALLLVCSSSFGAQKTLSFRAYSSSKGICQNTLRFDPAKYLSVAAKLACCINPLVFKTCSSEALA
jgi:hypothetical protein